MNNKSGLCHRFLIPKLRSLLLINCWLFILVAVRFFGPSKGVVGRKIEVVWGMIWSKWGFLSNRDEILCFFTLPKGCVEGIASSALLSSVPPASENSFKLHQIVVEYFDPNYNSHCIKFRCIFTTLDTFNAFTLNRVSMVKE